MQSFHHYPLYKYMVPEAGSRAQFMRKYFEANYDVTVARGRAILLSIKAPRSAIAAESAQSKGSCCDDDDEPHIIGGVMFLLPSKTGWGWQADEQAPFDDAYDRHGLAEVSADGLARLKRYAFFVGFGTSTHFSIE